MGSASTSENEDSAEQNTSLALDPATLSSRLPASQVRVNSSQQTIDNPLLVFDDIISRPGTGKTELEEYVSNFAKRSGLEDRFDLLLFGTRLARDKHETMTRYDDELTSSEKKLIEEEEDKHTGFWKQSKFFRATIITASLGGAIQGWTQSANNGTINGMPEQFGLCINPSPANSCKGNTADLWTFGMLNAIPLLSAGLFGTTLADPLQENYLGRRGSVFVSALITVASTIGASVTHTVGQLAACRAINGIALGAKASIIPIYSAEISPKHIRGAILANWQLADAAGIFLGFVANLITISYVSDPYRSWRILTNTVLIPTIPLLIMIYLMPESPRYLMKHGEYQRALEAFIMIQTTPLLASRDFMYAHAQLDIESSLMTGNDTEQGNLADRIGPSRDDVTNTASHTASGQSTGSRNVRDQRALRDAKDGHRGTGTIEMIDISSIGGAPATQVDGVDATSAGQNDNPYAYHIGVTGYFKRLFELWSNRRCRRAFLSASVAMITQQMTGVNTIAFLGTTVWMNALGTTSNPRVGAIIGLLFGAANYLGGLPAYWLSDKYGRSILLCVGLPNMAWSMLVFALLFQIPHHSGARVPMVSIFAIIFTLFYAPTAGTSPFSISAEVFPLVSREVGMAVSVAINLLGAGILVQVFPMLLNRIGPSGSLSIFAGLNLVAFVLVFLFVPETKRRTLEELQYTFDLPTRLHVRYRAGYIRRYFFKNAWKFATGKKIRPPVPFYRWARNKHGERVGP